MANPTVPAPENDLFAEAEWDEAQAVSVLVSGLVDTITSVKGLVATYAEEPHSDGCGFDACVRCVVDEFAALVASSGQSGGHDG